MPLPIVESTPATLAVVEPYQRPAITPRGVAAGGEGGDTVANSNGVGRLDHGRRSRGAGNP